VRMVGRIAAISDCRALILASRSSQSSGNVASRNPGG
jgi:hypothetical protein